MTKIIITDLATGIALVRTVTTGKAGRKVIRLYKSRGLKVEAVK